MKQQERIPEELNTLAAPVESGFNLLGLTIIVSGHVLALGALFHLKWEWVLCGIVAHFFFAAFGLSLGNHRVASHQMIQFQAKWLEWMILILATLCAQGSPSFWAYHHRIHHTFSDTDHDPHNSKRGFFWAHLGWMIFKSDSVSIPGFGPDSLIKDLKKNSAYRFTHRYYLHINLIFMALLAAFSLLQFGNLGFFFWVGPARILMGWHTTWGINSFTHGLLPFFDTKDSKPTNISWYSLVLPGEGLHAIHHQYPKKFIYNEKRWYLDPGAMAILIFRKMGWVA